MTIVDLGCGVGPRLRDPRRDPRTQVVGVDTSAESLDYGAHHYARPDISTCARESA